MKWFIIAVMVIATNSNEKLKSIDGQPLSKLTRPLFETEQSCKDYIPSDAFKEQRDWLLEYVGKATDGQATVRFKCEKLPDGETTVK